MHTLPSVVGQAVPKRPTTKDKQRNRKGNKRKQKKKQNKKSTVQKPFPPKINIAEPTGIAKAFVDSLLNKPKDNLSPREARVIQAYERKNEKREQALHVGLNQGSDVPKTHDGDRNKVAISICKKCCSSTPETKKNPKVPDQEVPCFSRRRKTLKLIETQCMRKLESWLCLHNTPIPGEENDREKNYKINKTIRLKDIGEEDPEDSDEDASKDNNLSIGLKWSDVPLKSDFFSIASSLKSESSNHELCARSVFNYMTECKKVRIIPEPIAVFKNISAANKGEIKLNWYGLGDEKLVDTAKVSFALLDIQKMDLGNNRISDMASAKLLQSQSWQSLKHLDLSHNGIGPKGIKAIADMVACSSTSLEQLILANNKLRSTDVRIICTALALNKKLDYLDLSSNSLGFTGANEISKMILCNTTISVLKLSWTQLQAKGTTLIFQSMIANSNCSIMDLDLSYNAIGTFKEACLETLNALSKVLDHEKNANTKSLTHLNLSHNLLDHFLCEKLGETLIGNTSLLGLHMTGNKCSTIDSLGFLDIRRMENPQLCSGPDATDENIRFRQIIERNTAENKIINNIQLQMSRLKIFQSWNSNCSCWICCGWTEQRFTIIAQKDSAACVHFCFDSPAWTAHKMTPSSASESMIGQTAMKEYEIFRMCPPTQVLFFFTLNGQPIISNKYPKLAWRETILKNIVPPPPMYVNGNNQCFEINVLSMPVRQLELKRSGINTTDTRYGGERSGIEPGLGNNMDYVVVEIGKADSKVDTYRRMCHHSCPRPNTRQHWINLENYASLSVRDCKTVPGQSSNFDVTLSVFEGLLNHTTEEKHNQAFENDWKCAKIDKLVPSAEIGKVKWILNNNYYLIIEVFDFYCASEELDESCCLGIQTLVALALNTGIIDFDVFNTDKAIGIINEIIKLTSSEDPKRNNLEQLNPEISHVKRFQFLELLVGFAQERYNQVPSASRRLKLIIESHLISAQRRNTESFAHQRLFNNSVDEVVRSNYVALYEVFKICSSHLDSEEHEEIYQMTLTQWQGFCNQSGLLKDDILSQTNSLNSDIEKLDNRLTPKMVRHIFLWSKQLVKNENYDPAGTCLSFTEFLVALCNIAALESSNKITFFRFQQGQKFQEEQISSHSKLRQNTIDFDFVEDLVNSLRAIIKSVKVSMLVLRERSPRD